MIIWQWKSVERRWAAFRGDEKVLKGDPLGVKGRTGRRLRVMYGIIIGQQDLKCKECEV